MKQDKPQYNRKIGVVARELGISQRRIIEYEKIGLINPTREPKTNDRLYSDFEVKQVQRIKQLIHHQGFTLKSLVYLAAMVPCWKLFNCQKHKSCPTYNAPEQACWKIMQSMENKFCFGDCKKCMIFLASKKVDNQPIFEKPL